MENIEKNLRLKISKQKKKEIILLSKQKQKLITTNLSKEEAIERLFSFDKYIF